jgi:hypothetical protein
VISAGSPVLKQVVFVKRFRESRDEVVVSLPIDDGPHAVKIRFLSLPVISVESLNELQDGLVRFSFWCGCLDWLGYASLFFSHFSESAARPRIEYSIAGLALIHYSLETHPATHVFSEMQAKVAPKPFHFGDGPGRTRNVLLSTKLPTRSRLGFWRADRRRTPVSFTALGLAKTVPEVPIRDSIQSVLIRGEL